MRTRDNSPISRGGAEVPIKRRYAMSMPANPTPPPAEPTTPSAAMITFANDWQALAEPTHAGMAQDEAHQREMVAATGVIAPRASCTHVAVQDGDWTASTTWLNVSTEAFEVPGAGDRLGVPSGINVTMNNNTTTVYHSLRVDGKVTWATDQNTKLYIDDTIVVNHGGEWLHGTVANPVPAAYTSEVVFPSQTNLDAAKEKLLLQRGFLGMGANSMHPDGKIYIHGQVKDHWGTTSATVSAGATSVTLDAAPTGWEVGDSIHLMATQVRGYGNNSYTWSDQPVDNVTITAISGATITFSPATTYGHSVPSLTGMTDLKWYVVNFTRNVKYYSPADTPVHQRGHWMGMGNGIDVRWASFDWLGRTRKGLLDISFDATNDAARIAENGGVGDPDFDPTDNVRGRYNFHLHRTGVEVGQPFATVTGISCTEAQGWLIAHHQGNANFTECVGRDFLGSGMVAEMGAEAGKWLDCFMGQGKRTETRQGSQSDKREFISEPADSQYGPYIGKFGVNRKYKNDFGRNGNAFWFRSRGVEVDGCVAAGASRGMVWMARGVLNGSTPSSLPYDGRIFYGYEQVAGQVNSDTPILLVYNSKICAVETPILVIKTTPGQDHNLRTHIHSNDMWEISQSLEFEYTGHYTLENNRIARTTKSLQSGFTKAEAIQLASAAADFYISDNVVRGFGDAVVRKTTRNVRFRTKDFGNVIVDNHTTDAAALFEFDFTQADPDRLLRIEDPAGLSAADPAWTPAAEPVWPNYTSEFGFKFYIFVGPLTTEFETRNRSHETETSADIVNPAEGLSSRFGETQLQLMLSRYGYYTYNSNNYLLVPDLISKKLPPTPGADIPTRYLTVPVRLTGVDLSEYTNQGAMPSRYSDAIVAGTYVVYEDILGTGGLYEGL